MQIVLVGAGGHAKAVVEAIKASSHELAAYVDPVRCSWLPDVAHFQDDAEFLEGKQAATIALGIGAVDPDGLRLRYELFRRYRGRGASAPPIVHPSSTVSRLARVGDGALVLAGAIVQPGAVVGEAAIVNTGAIVEHDSMIGAGAHVAPGAILLGGVQIGSCAMVGAGAAVLPGAVLDEAGLVPSLGRYPK